MLHDIEQAMGYANMAAAVVLFARLGAQGLVRTYPFLFAYPFAGTLEQIAASVFAQRPNLYAEIYFVGQTVKVALAIFVVLELYELSLAQQPALARFGRRIPGYLFLIAVMVGLIALLLESDDADCANHLPQLTHELSVAMLTASLACFIGWSLMLKREGEEEIVVIW